MKTHEIPYQIKQTNNITQAELLEILKCSEDGFDGLVSKRSRLFIKELSKAYDKLSFNELFELLLENPNLLRGLLITDGKKMLSGWNQEEAHKFIPHEKRLMHRKMMTNNIISKESEVAY